MSRWFGRLAAASGFVGLVALAGYAIAQTAFPTPAGSSANGSVAMCPSTASAALKVPCDATNPLYVAGAAGTAIIGKVGIDQTTPGTTNNVSVSPLPRAARNFPGCTVGTSSGSCLTASTAVSFLQVQNTSTGAAIACAFGATPVLNSSTSLQLAAGQSASWGPVTAGVPTGALNCIASSASTPLYVEWN